MVIDDIHEALKFTLTPIIQELMHHLHQAGLTGPQIHALLHIYHTGECQVAEIGALSESSPAAASQLVERLVQQGLVQRSEDPQNRRIKKLRLTARSLELITQGVTSNRFLMDLMAQLTAEQLQTVQSALGYLAQAGRQVHSTHERKAKNHASFA
jgi:DNA-binding MarR family transcriptional regulator